MLQRYQKWLDHEESANESIVSMLESVRVENQSSPSFPLALCLAGHIAACRNNWLARMLGDKENDDWWPAVATVSEASLALRSYVEPWREYLRGLNDETVVADFDFEAGDGNRYRWNVEGQIMQMIGHGFYHRGQIALLVDQLGGNVVNTDYLFWAYDQDDRWGVIQKV